MLATTIQGDGRQNQYATIVKKRATAEEIQADLKGRIERCTELGGKCCDCGTPLPRPAKAKKPGDPNWVVDGLPGLVSGCFGTIVRIVDQARLEYELVS
jgi:hypothetical protein